MSASADSQTQEAQTAIKLQWELVRHYLTPIAPYFRQEGVTGIFVNRYDSVYIMRFGEFERVDARWNSEFHFVTAIEQIANALGQEVHAVDRPLLDARLDDGSRINAVLAPTGVAGSNMTVRLFPKTRFTADALLKAGAFDQAMHDYLRLAMLNRFNMVVSGGTGSGKTTLLNAVSNFIPDDDRIVSIEDTAELQINGSHWVALEAPHRFAKDVEPLTMSRLVKNALRMEPQRLIIGEVRDGPAAEALLTAANTGHSGILSTIHANNALDTIDRLTNLAASGFSAIPYEHVQRQVRNNLDVILHAQKTPHHGRRIVEIAELANGEFRLLWRWNYAEGRHEQVADPSTHRMHYTRTH
ncbi:Flp pilus assembly complex ATPase component TadA [Schlegelella sp. S2-27]|uniref:Flp pilus assembly complex ATPase component TadA n=1 Tax=Caldimonas mangrovi TaxID=2944811 RepID=A0ABT0YUJ9_9BURK|nr:ATPase, T2SS/T4P/T4SS family [Caldimonas mangrovi]MCM5682421.1 Flp pilus assembly complex ATPase component TadA [Caldimonas mangrovi]